MAKHKARATPIPQPSEDVDQPLWTEAITAYLHDVKTLNSESARSHRFAMLLDKLFGEVPGFIEDYVSGVEKFVKIKQKDRILRGKTDNLFGNLIIEFEGNIEKKRKEAEEQLRRYTAIVWSKEVPDDRTAYLCMATDGVRFLTYTPVVDDPALEEVGPENVQLRLLENYELDEDERGYYWLDRNLLRKTIQRPTSEKIVHDFGEARHPFQTITSRLFSLWNDVKSQSNFSVVYENWHKYLRIMYDSQFLGEELFIRHTYLATLAKVMAWVRIGEIGSIQDDRQVQMMLEGRWFKDQGVENFIEEDFFSWLGRNETISVGISVTRWLLSLLQNYDLSLLSEDVLKALYQQLVDKETRHGLGEVYTPDWLARRIVARTIEPNPKASAFDPACGSGTFLYLTIRAKLHSLPHTAETLQHILDSVYGVDIHPLAVVIAKTNYLLALGDLVQQRTETISIPVYLSNSLRLPVYEQAPTFDLPLPGYKFDLGGTEVLIPAVFVQDASLYDHTIELLRDYAWKNRGEDRTLDEEAFHNYLQANQFRLVEDAPLVKTLFRLTETLKDFIDKGRDTIWAFVLKNAYKPVLLKLKFDVLFGNPPWVVFRNAEPNYQAFLRHEIRKAYKLVVGKAHLTTHLEVASLFFLRAADLYLKKGGVINFVMPRNIFTADQHDGLRQQTYQLSECKDQTVVLDELWDCDSVKNLFNVPACVLFGHKTKASRKTKAKDQLPGEALSGKLPERNPSLVEVNAHLSAKKTTFYLNLQGSRSFWSDKRHTGSRAASFYRKLFEDGATIYPRPFWFVQPKASQLGVNPKVPLLETDKRLKGDSQQTYKGVALTRSVESQFLYTSLLNEDFVPFGHLDYRLIVAPIEPYDDAYRLLDAEAANARGFIHLAGWLKEVEQIWKKRRGAKAGVTALEWLNHRSKLTKQKWQVRYTVVYTASASYIAAAVIEKELIQLMAGQQRLACKGFLVDHKHWYFKTDDEEEAYYLASVLNAPVLDEKKRAMQTRGLFGTRDIHKKVLEFPIPQFDPKNAAHKELAELGQACTKLTKEFLPQAKKWRSIGKLRSEVRRHLGERLERIDELTAELLA